MVGGTAPDNVARDTIGWGPLNFYLGGRKGYPIIKNCRNDRPSLRAEAFKTLAKRVRVSDVRVCYTLNGPHRTYR